jgi:hypothetical protein
VEDSIMVDQLTTCQPSDTTGRTRTRFFPGLLLGSDDLTQEQQYVLERLRRHNRLLHGWGVVCGARVRAGDDPCRIVVEPGYILGPYGDEIVIDRETTVDLCREGLDGNAVSPCGDALDPWCSDIQVDRRAGQSLYVAIRYDECLARPVRSAATACGCDLSDCEYSRVRDSFAIKVLTRLPSTYDPMPPAELQSAVTCSREERGRTCTACPTEPWVILADVKLTTERTIGTIDCFTHRRYVASFADYYFLCDANTDRDVTIRRRGDIRTVGRAEMIDLTAGRDARARATVAVRAAGGEWLSLPIDFDVVPGETWAALLAREGGREYYNPIDDEQETLGEIAALAAIQPDATIETINDVVVPLEGLKLDVGDLRVIRDDLGDLIREPAIAGWERDQAGRVEALTVLPATSLAPVEEASPLADKLGGATIGDIAAEDRDAFVARMSEGVAAGDLTAVEQRARETWTAATRVTRRRDAWVSQHGVQ